MLRLGMSAVGACLVVGQLAAQEPMMAQVFVVSGEVRATPSGGGVPAPLAWGAALHAGDVVQVRDVGLVRLLFEEGIDQAKVVVLGPGQSWIVGSPLSEGEERDLTPRAARSIRSTLIPPDGDWREARPSSGGVRTPDPEHWIFLIATRDVLAPDRIELRWIAETKAVNERVFSWRIEVSDGQSALKRTISEASARSESVDAAGSGLAGELTWTVRLEAFDPGGESLGHDARSLRGTETPFPELRRDIEEIDRAFGENDPDRAARLAARAAVHSGFAMYSMAAVECLEAARLAPDRLAYRKALGDAIRMDLKVEEEDASWLATRFLEGG